VTRSALVLVAHADDETLGCGGLVAKLVRRGWRVDVAIASDAVLTTRGQEQDNRADALAACRTLGIVESERVHFLGFQDQKFDRYPIADIANAVAALELQPELILTHDDTDLNLDHRIINEVAKIVGRPRQRPISILACESPAASFWNGRQFAANYYVDVTEEIDVKVAAFECYRNEVRSYPDPWSGEGLRLLARYHGMHCGLPMAEAFAVIRGYGGSLP
jgi:N-acetylglucosamine malate deacetylase 1